MALPVYLQSFKAAGIYRVVFDKSTIEGVDSEILRLVVGYSEKGPFNTPTYVKTVQQFKTLYGDISTKLEKRGIYFHRLALQCLSKGPILALNLKKFNRENVGASTISTAFSNKLIDNPISTVKLKLEDIYDTSRFWTKDALQLIDAREFLPESGEYGPSTLDEYIDIAITDTDKTSASYFIRKANGNKVNSYNISISDWYKDSGEDIPEYLESKANCLVSDFFAEIYLFKGEFKKDQVLASNTLKRYFKVDNNNLVLKEYVENAYGDKIDTLDSLYNDSNSGAIAHYVGCLIPGFKDKQGNYASLDIIFNNDIDIHNMMMAFKTDLLEDGYNIDLSGKAFIDNKDNIIVYNDSASVNTIFNGKQKTKLLGNLESPVNASRVGFSNNLPTTMTYEYADKYISGYFWVSVIAKKGTGSTAVPALTLSGYKNGETTHSCSIYCVPADYDKLLNKFGISNVVFGSDGTGETATSATGNFVWLGTTTEPWKSGTEISLKGCNALITKLSNINKNESTTTNEYTYNPAVTKIASVSVGIEVNNYIPMKVDGKDVEDTNSNQVYGDSVIFIPTANQQSGENPTSIIKSDDKALGYVCSVGDAFLGVKENANVEYHPVVYVQSVEYDVVEGTTVHACVVKFSGNYATITPSGGDANYLIKLAAPLNQEIGSMAPTYLSGYTFENAKPASTGMKDKLDWQHTILSALEDYTGLRTGLLNKSDIDYRYIIDTFESFVEGSCKNKIAYLAKQKDSAFAIINFPSIKTFIKCPYTSFVDSNGRFNVQYIVDGKNKKKASTVSFSLPSESDGASYCAFYTPLKFSDGYVDNIVPSAALVSNLFMQKYLSRYPYSIVAGPNHANIAASGLIGPDYNFSQDELQIIEPFGVNCMIYRPTFGTFVNANQTAKQTPVSALSKVNVRELVIFLQDEIEKVLQSYQWEFNSPTVRSAIKIKADQICARAAANGGIQAYLNVCDESNNTPEVIDNEMCILSTHIEPGMGAGKMVQELTLYRTGQMSATITE